jgi:3',5'-cyclic AMP phosphodiesterase CpdA
MGFITATLPSVPVPGNHDLHRAPDQPDSKTALSVSPLWRHHFLLPENGPDAPELKSQSYYMDYQGVRFIALDVNAFANEAFDANSKTRIQQKQLVWLDKLLANNPNRWTIVVQHQALFSLAKDRDYSDMRAALGPLYEKYHVDLVLLGHDHCYGRTHKLAAEHVVDAKAPGVVYVTSSSGSKMYKLHEMHKELMAVRLENKQCFQVISVSTEGMGLTAYSADGAVVDAFELRKNGSGTSLVEQIGAKR